MIAFGLLLTAGTGIFVASEFSMLNLERSDLEGRAERGEKGLANSIRALRRTTTHLSGAQLGITLTTMLTGFLAEPALSHLLFGTLSPLMNALGFGGKPSVETQTAISLVLTMFLTTLVSTLFGELVPKKLALTLPLEVNRFVVNFQLTFYPECSRQWNCSLDWHRTERGVEFNPNRRGAEFPSSQVG
jgi:CBS domain containing-hemolysin-like protein